MRRRQTASFLRQRLTEIGVSPSSRHGQNFLIDLNLLELLERSAKIGPRDVVLEVGTGTGSLTEMMSDKAATVVTVEIDANLHALASEELFGRPNIVMLHQDALKNKNRIHDNVLNAINDALAAGEDLQFKLAANLPYNIATPLISNLLLNDPHPVSLTVTIQKELADRITATPRSKDYGALSVWVQNVADPEIVRIMPPSVFWPRPKVDSAIIHIESNEEKRAAIRNLKFFHQFTRAMFFHRRKFLRSELISAFKKELDKPQVDEIMAEQELVPEARTEELTPPQILNLCHAVLDRVPSDFKIL
jgi:16S rRNA (adenine1518-N6/adenine1519-N6)-dimethyltransferase